MAKTAHCWLAAALALAALGPACAQVSFSANRTATIKNKGTGLYCSDDADMLRCTSSSVNAAQKFEIITADGTDRWLLIKGRRAGQWCSDLGDFQVSTSTWSNERMVCSTSATEEGIKSIDSYPWSWFKIVYFWDESFFSDGRVSKLTALLSGGRRTVPHYCYATSALTACNQREDSSVRTNGNGYSAARDKYRFIIEYTGGLLG